jgi:hypothetical protein
MSEFPRSEVLEAELAHRSMSLMQSGSAKNAVVNISAEHTNHRTTTRGPNINLACLDSEGRDAPHLMVDCKYETLLYLSMYVISHMNVDLDDVDLSGRMNPKKIQKRGGWPRLNNSEDHPGPRR